MQLDQALNCVQQELTTCALDHVQTTGISFFSTYRLIDNKLSFCFLSKGYKCLVEDLKQTPNGFIISKAVIPNYRYRRQGFLEIESNLCSQ